MSEPFLGEIQLFAFNFSPADWAFCNGQLLPISQYSTLYSLLGTAFGGNGTQNFGVPNFQGNAACAVGQGPGLTNRTLGEPFGAETVTLSLQEMPQHSHLAQMYNQRDVNKRQGAPQANSGIVAPANTSPFTTSAANNSTFASDTIGFNGGNQAHPNQQPYLTLNFCIALNGIFPSRS